MNRKIHHAFLLTLILSALPCTMAAASIPFRGGEILSAELSTHKPWISHTDPLAFQFDFDKRVYAAVVLKLAPGRKLSIYDYSLDVFGRIFPCVALKRLNGSFDARVWQLEQPSTQEKYLLLFVVDGRNAGINKIENLELKCNFPPQELNTQLIPFYNIGNDNFTSEIPDTGIVKVQK